MLPKDYQDMVMQTSVGSEGKMQYEVLGDHVISMATKQMQLMKPVPMDIGNVEGQGGPREQEMGYATEEIGMWIWWTKE